MVSWTVVHINDEALYDMDIRIKQVLKLLEGYHEKSIDDVWSYLIGTNERWLCDLSVNSV